jgi:hypothetical protein
MELLINNSKFQAINSNGVPLVGGKLYSYAAGTTTPLTTYSNYELSAANTNPVILDSRGEAFVYCSSLLKLILKTSDDVVIWTVDNIHPKFIFSSFSDADGDTKIEVEKIADEDKIRLTCAGTEMLLISALGMSGPLLLDEDNMISDSALHAASQQSIKKYVDSFGSIPTGTILLFEKDTAVVGYTLLTTLDDMVVYITKGSVAGGAIGGESKAGGTWTTLASGSHTLTIAQMPAHRHVPNDGRKFRTGTNLGGPYDEDSGGQGADTQYTDYQGGGESHSHPAPANTWRPPGRNFTRQQRN